MLPQAALVICHLLHLFSLSHAGFTRGQESREEGRRIHVRYKADVTHLIVNADDFGASSRVNAAIARSHREGVLTSTSVMVAGAASTEASELARRTPGLAVGLHVVLSAGKAALPHEAIPRISGPDGALAPSPALAGLRAFFLKDVRREVLREIHAQAELFGRLFGHCDHVNGHQHLHVHPVVWDCLVDLCGTLGCRAIRVPREELWMPANAPRGRVLEWAFFRALARRCLRSARRAGLLVADRVYGHLASGLLSEAYLLDLIPRLRASVCEIYAHPGTNEPAQDAELSALISPKVREAARLGGVQLTTYSNLAYRDAAGGGSD